MRLVQPLGALGSNGNNVAPVHQSASRDLQQFMQAT